MLIYFFKSCNSCDVEFFFFFRCAFFCMCVQWQIVIQNIFHIILHWNLSQLYSLNIWNSSKFVQCYYCRMSLRDGCSRNTVAHDGSLSDIQNQYVSRKLDHERTNQSICIHIHLHIQINQDKSGNPIKSEHFWWRTNTIAMSYIQQRENIYNIDNSEKKILPRPDYPLS